MRADLNNEWKKCQSMWNVKPSDQEGALLSIRTFKDELFLNKLSKVVSVFQRASSGCHHISDCDFESHLNINAYICTLGGTYRDTN